MRNGARDRAPSSCWRTVVALPVPLFQLCSLNELFASSNRDTELTTTAEQYDACRLSRIKCGAQTIGGYRCTVDAENDIAVADRSPRRVGLKHEQTTLTAITEVVGEIIADGTQAQSG